MERYEFDPHQAYRLVAIEDRHGNDKSQSKSLYQGIINCTAINLHWDANPVFKNAYRLNMYFIRNEDGKPIRRSLHISVVEKITTSKTGMTLYTMYSVYRFKMTILTELQLRSDTNFIELYMSNNDNYLFGAGIYYDENGQSHILKERVHLGMFQDSVLIVDPEYGSIICRYFPNWGSAEFYAVNANEPQKGTSYLIHNTGKDELVIRFERYSKKWTIKPGKSKTIVPYRADGADGEEEILCQ